MIVYHGSRVIVKKPDIFHSRERVDFGRGFYITPLFEQAKNLCFRYKNIGEDAFVSKCELSEKIFASDGIKRKQFDTYSDEWLDFVMTCRRGQDETDYDVIVGGVANDKVFDTVELYFQKLISKEEALGRLRYEKPNLQICIRKQDVIDKFLEFKGSERV